MCQSRVVSQLTDLDYVFEFMRLESNYLGNGKLLDMRDRSAIKWWLSMCVIRIACIHSYGDKHVRSYAREFPRQNVKLLAVVFFLRTKAACDK